MLQSSAGSSKGITKEPIVQRALATCIALLLSLAPAALQAQAEPAASEAPPSPEEIERLVESLEDPEARARLVEELKILLEARREAEAAAEAPTAGGIVEMLREAVVDAWERLTSIDPRQIL